MNRQALSAATSAACCSAPWPRSRCCSARPPRWRCRPRSGDGRRDGSWRGDVPGGTACGLDGDGDDGGFQMGYHGCIMGINYKYLSIPFLNGRWRRCFLLRDDRTGVLALEFQWIHICSMLGLCRAHVGSIVGSMLSHVGPMLRPCRAYGEACWAMLSHCWSQGWLHLRRL